jgi:PAT family beta-lactamase induction signal transducer AmpG
MTQRSERLRHLLLFSSLYFAQGAILSYFLTFNVLYLRERGFAADEIGFFQAVLVLPFVLKILLGIISDRFSLLGLGHRYPYILLGLVLQVAAFLVLPGIDLPTGLDLFFVVALTAAVGMALYDTGTDGLAVESTADEDRGLVQGLMVGARATGILVTLLSGGWLVEHVGWHAVFILIVGLTLPGLALAVLFRERRVQVNNAAFDWSAFSALSRQFVLVLALMGLLFASALDGVLTYLSFHRDGGGIADIGLLSGLVALSMLGRIVGALATSFATRRLGYVESIRIAILLSAMACLLLALEAGVVVLAAACFVFGFAYGCFTAVYAASAMVLSDTRIAASMFAVFMMFLNIGVAVGQAIGGVVVEGAGFPTLAWMMTVVALVTLVFVPALRQCEQLRHPPS